MSNLKNYLFTSESVSEGHPDKVSDRISDMVVDSYLSADPFSRVACETLTTTNKVVGKTLLGLFPASMQISETTGLLYCVNFNLHGE